MACEKQEIGQLQLEAVIGFNGRVLSGLRVHPDLEHIIYPLGCTVILQKIADGKQQFLHGHTNNISCISVSRSGKYFASGQVTSMTTEAGVIIWNYCQKAVHANLELHMGKVECLAFSPNDKYLVSLGGLDDGSLVIWDIETKQAVCGSPASAHSTGQCLTVRFSNTDDNVFVSGGSGTLRIWKLDRAERKITPTECNSRKLKRTVKCIEITQDDELIFCGTASGDIMKIKMMSGLMIEHGPFKTKYSLGVSALTLLRSGDLLVGSGAGTLALCSTDKFKTLKKIQLEKGVTSITFRGEKQFFVGTESAQMYRFCCESFTAELISTNHTNGVKDIVFPFGTSEVFATCSDEDIRLWHTEKPKELLRIVVSNMICNCLDFMRDGHSIISGWNDNKIRVFGPESGRLIFEIIDAHKMGVTTIAGTRDCRRIVSGGGEGEVRVWELLPHSHRLLETMKQHKSSISSLKLNANDKECVTASADGTCIIWDLERFTNLQMIIANTLFHTVCYHPEEHQIITSSTEKKVTYWDVYDGTAIRELDGSLSGSIHAMDITQDGKYFVTGGDDKLVKVWDYMTGEVTHVGFGQGGSITSTKICCNNTRLLSSSTDGAILCWKFPYPSCC